MWRVEEDLQTRSNRVHNDDIHAMLWANNNTSNASTSRQFITGSKDNTVRLWNLNHADNKIEFQKQIRENSRSYDSWVTALTPICTNQHFLYGTRDGMLGLIHEEHGDVGTFTLPKSKEKAKCKTRNQDRITTLYSLQEYDPDLNSFALIGMPRSIICAQIKVEDTNDHNGRESEDPPSHSNQVQSSFKIVFEENIHSNDWVYCVYPIVSSASHEKVYTCVVTGSSLHVYSIPSPLLIEQVQEDCNTDGFKPVVSRSSLSRKDSSPAKVKLVRTIWQEDRISVAAGNNRAHIARLEGLKKTNPVWISAACFDSSIRIFDFKENKLVQTIQFGENLRYWQCQEYAANILLSCADDGFLRIWDTRIEPSKANVGTSPRHVGRVSSFLINADNHSVMTASCHSNIKHPNFQGACLRVFDIRYLEETDSKPSNIDDLSENMEKSLNFTR